MLLAEGSAGCRRSPWAGHPARWPMTRAWALPGAGSCSSKRVRQDAGAPRRSCLYLGLLLQTFSQSPNLHERVSRAHHSPTHVLAQQASSSGSRTSWAGRRCSSSSGTNSNPAVARSMDEGDEWRKRWIASQNCAGLPDSGFLSRQSQHTLPLGCESDTVSGKIRRRVAPWRQSPPRVRGGRAAFRSEVAGASRSLPPC